MTGLALALVAGAGVFLLWSASTSGRDDGGGRPLRPRPPRSRARIDEWLVQAGLADVPLRTFAAAMTALFLGGALVGVTLFAGPVPAILVGVAFAALPPAAYRNRRRRLAEEARDAWPRLIEEIRIATGSMGRSIPQALIEVGGTAPEPMRPAFAAAAREWRMSTDFRRMIDVLKRTLADPTADAACETLLVAHEVGGADLERRLRHLAEDRLIDLHGRRDAAAKQAGVRFARRFVIVVPIGMALAGMSIGTGRAAYETPVGQAAVVAGLVSVAACWAWAGHYLRLPAEERVFRERS